MADIGDKDSLWQSAVDWVMREHEGLLDSAARDALTAWLQESPAHRTAYEEASRVWLLTGLLPPSFEEENESPSRSASDE